VGPKKVPTSNLRRIPFRVKRPEKNAKATARTEYDNEKDEGSKLAKELLKKNFF